MMQAPQSERIITPEHKAVAPNTMVMAFAVEPLLRWILPSVNSDISSNPALLDSFSSVAFVVDRILQIAYLAGVALWLPPSDTKDADANEAAVSDGLR